MLKKKGKGKEIEKNKASADFHSGTKVQDLAKV